MKVARGNCRAALLASGKALIVGNWYADATKAEVCDPVTNTFTLTFTMVKERFATTMGNEEVSRNVESLKVYAENNFLRVLCSGVPAGNQQLSIIDISGRLRYTIQVKLYEGINSTNFPVTHSKGIYILRLGNQSARFIVR